MAVGDSRRLTPAGVGVALLLALAACGARREVAVQQARAGDTLVAEGDTRVDLVQAFRPGFPNGLYRGVVRVQEPGAPAGGQLYTLSGICSVRNQPGWPTYDNLYGHRIDNLAEAERPASKKQGQVLYHFDGRIEASGGFIPTAWMQRLKDNLCRRGDFDDRPAEVRSKG
ncbi:hypothetical protein KBZ20_06890 [Vulcanococcus limneticus Candia 3F8]|uniref:hypothetical protein n=1 Tax=Vulcanococcus limneticus TaxID=2170428 RepID=UPI000B98749C|nr:hypothetical protein [Vulcanococcus limneticus]MCP9791174.1 hypothetical protein [Vulcanococcus limneticus MW73D5]MCP9893496.1 hypothetical protein [Vulcanococcus limneticus Candia 3F8]MCP9896572.1 hypothetical protein [Vulcanococcus limneticus Candia 3B3]